MNSNGRHTGIPSEGELLAGPGIPDRERIEKGPVAFIECVQDIPCNPCEEACPFGAALWDETNHKPQICVYCGYCADYCPYDVIKLEEIAG